MRFTSRTTRGFSLVEVLVAVSLLMIAVVGPMTILTRATNSTTFASEQAIAFFLAQEGLELVQKGRDDLVLRYFEYQYDGTGNNTPIASFDTAFNTCITGSCGLEVNSLSPAGISIRSCAAISNCRLYTLTGNTAVRPVYRYTAGVLTPYTRVITITRVPSSGTPVREYKVTSRVTWRSGSFIADQSVTLETYLENTYANN